MSLLQYGRVIALLALPLSAVADEARESALHCFRTEQVAGELEQPWGMAFLPGGEFLVTVRGGQLWRLQTDGTRIEVAGVPSVVSGGQGGLLDVALHPEHASNRLIYLAYTAGSPAQRGTDVARARLLGNQLADVQTVFSMRPRKTGDRHFGSRLLFAPDGTLLISLGDRADRSSAQDLEQHSGSIIRIHDDGRIPEDNPFGTSSAIYSYGHRNVQGMVFVGERLWAHEHGPMGGDELNQVDPGRNYGWPLITYGVNYGIGTAIGEGTHKAGMEQPVHYWVPSIGPSGLAHYRGDAFPNWQGNLFAGSLKFGLLVRLQMQDGQVVHEERLLEGVHGRIRDVRLGPDGLLYLLSGESSGALLRVVPCN